MIIAKTEKIGLEEWKNGFQKCTSWNGKSATIYRQKLGRRDHASCWHDHATNRPTAPIVQVLQLFSKLARHGRASMEDGRAYQIECASGHRRHVSRVGGKDPQESWSARACLAKYSHALASICNYS
ncbi:hypothetical protein L1987_83607 [Smallanthus sonchifolius]|uniref:Uncharacterized protein n=1 Tax=Smallanthus sonchifolius TaxID=185202 RepID=A0ACB8YD28_9ASTR|nr:hypothetical protein L1987_83607 [Smallanthus sonchifolius]